MTSLRVLQEHFWSWMRTQGCAGPAALVRDEAPRFVVSAGALDAAARVGIYRRMYWGRQIAALGDTYAELAATLAEDDGFATLASAYIDQHPSTDPRLEHLGQHLPAFLANASNPAWRALADRAREIWAETAASLAPDATALTDLSSLAPATFAEARLVWVPSLGWADLPAAPVAFWRRGPEVLRFAVPLEEHAGLALARRGECLGLICGALARETPDEREATELVGRILGHWFARGWIAAVEVSPCV